MNFTEIKQKLQRFAVIDRDKDGYITEDDLAHYLKVPSDACLRAVFNTFQKVNSLLCWEGVYHLMPY